MPKESRPTNQIVRESLTEALFQLMDSKHFEDISITELTRRAGVGRVSFYRNFNSKEDILMSYLDGKAGEWWEAIQQEEKPDVILSLFRHLAGLERPIKLLYKAGLSHLLLRNIQNCCGPKPMQPNTLAYWNAWLAGGLFGWVDEWVKRGMQESPEEMARLVASVSQGK